MVDVHKTAYVQVCLVFAKDVLTAQPAVVVPILIEECGEVTEHSEEQKEEIEESFSPINQNGPFHSNKIEGW